MDAQNFKTLRKKILWVLRNYDETRNSDIALMIELWKNFYREFIMQSPNTGQFAVKLSHLYDLPREDAIKRVRAQIQNEDGLYPPTVWAVAKKRGYNEIEWQKSLGYNVDHITGQTAIIV